MKAELCKTCIHTKVCFHDKNLVGDTFVRGFFDDLDDAWEKFKEWEKAGFPCDDYIPAADVVEVVRCRECKWFVCNMREDGYLPPNVPAFWCKARQIDDPDPTDYCSLGERKEGAE